MEYVRVQGERIPALGLGTWELTGRACRRAVEEALALGYRHIDTAQIYANEAEVGDALAASDVERGDVFLTTKVWNRNLGRGQVAASTQESLTKLRTDYVDLLLIHWPVAMDRIGEVLDEMRQLQDAGQVRHLGVSNFTAGQVEESLAHATILCNQVEYHPYLGQQTLLEAARKHDLMLTAYSPLGRGALLRDPTLTAIARTHGKSAAQVAVRWLIDQENVSAIPKATSREHVAANLDIFDFHLSEQERAAIGALDRRGRVIDPSFAPSWDR
jgi:2,5-diketo-D-gluconate reductase B